MHRHRKVFSAALVGVEGAEVEIEVNLGRGDPRMIIVGLPDTAVRESVDRVLTAIRNSGLRPPEGRTTVNLAPADLRKEGPSFDLPIAVGMVAAVEDLGPETLEEVGVVGELALDGRVRRVRGVLSLTLLARAAGRRRMLVPAENAPEAAVVDGIEVYGVGSLNEALALLRGESAVGPEPWRGAELLEAGHRHEVDYADVRGQAHARRALEVAAAGGHNILLVGPPGTGKSMLAKRIVTILPPFSEAEAIETTRIYSACGRLEPGCSLVARRPFRAPHHTISDAGLLGGSTSPSPGEVSLAHHGALFLDELPEFRRSTLEVLRQPLEDGQVTISRASGTMTFQSRFLLVSAMNPCPCGYHGDPRRECRCSPPQVDRYRRKISGPLLDRIDLHVEVPPVDYRELSSARAGESSSEIRGRVLSARRIQARRFEGSGIFSNSGMTAAMVRSSCRLDRAASDLLEQAMTELDLSARAHDRILKVARTLADLAGGGDIDESHVLEAIDYRALDRSRWR